LGFVSLAMFKIFCDLGVFGVKVFLLSLVKLLCSLVCLDPLSVFFWRKSDSLLEGYMKYMKVFRANLLFVGVVKIGDSRDEALLFFGYKMMGKYIKIEVIGK